MEDYTYSDELRVSTLDLSNFTNLYQMLEFTRMRMAEYGKPRVSYVLSAMDLSVLTGYEREKWELGDIVTSAQIGLDNLKKGANGQVGIEVVFEYEDGITETRFIDLF